MLKSHLPGVPIVILLLGGSVPEEPTNPSPQDTPCTGHADCVVHDHAFLLVLPAEVQNLQSCPHSVHV